jgi:aconitase B
MSQKCFCRCDFAWLMPVGILESVLARFKGKVQYGITLMNWMIAEGYQDARTLKRCINAMEEG